MTPKTPLLDRLRAAILQPLPEPAPVGPEVFAPACVPTWQSQCDAVDSILDSLETA